MELLFCGKHRRLEVLIGVTEPDIPWFWTSIPEGSGVLKRVLIKVLQTDVSFGKEEQVIVCESL